MHISFTDTYRHSGAISTLLYITKAHVWLQTHYYMLIVICGVIRIKFTNTTGFFMNFLDVFWVWDEKFWAQKPRIIEDRE